MKTTIIEFTNKDSKAFLATTVFENGEKEHLLHINESVTKYASLENASTRLETLGYSNPVLVESVDLPKTFKVLAEQFSSINMEETLNESVDPVDKRRAVFEMVYSKNAKFPNQELAQLFLESINYSIPEDEKKLMEMVTEFCKTPHEYLSESVQLIEAAAPGMEDWVIANKQKFIDQYGKKKGLSVLYATAWKIHDKKLNEAINPVQPVTPSNSNSQNQNQNSSKKQDSGFAEELEKANRKNKHQSMIDFHEKEAEKHETRYVGGDSDSHKDSAQAHLYAADQHREALRKLAISPIGNPTHEQTYQKAAEKANKASESANKKLNEAFVYGRGTHPDHGNIEWSNEGGFDTISKVDKKTGFKSVAHIGRHDEISKKWGALKDKFLKESSEWTFELDTLIESVAKEYGV